MTSETDESLTAFEALFAPHGGTPLEYLRPHYPRFLATRREFLSSWTRNGGRVLDLGAHWLHQSMLYATRGFHVVAVDLPMTLELDNVRRLAAAHPIELVAEHDLEGAKALRVIPDDSIDVVLFTEIIKHITFNPVAMWREVHRVMKPGARIRDDAQCLRAAWPRLAMAALPAGKRKRIGRARHSSHAHVRASLEGILACRGDRVLSGSFIGLLLREGIVAA